MIINGVIDEAAVQIERDALARAKLVRISVGAALMDTQVIAIAEDGSERLIRLIIGLEMTLLPSAVTPVWFKLDE